jgi:superfamily II DNA or RNA helicase
MPHKLFCLTMTNDTEENSSVQMIYPEGTQVRLVSEPSRVGVCTGRTRERGGVTMVQVRFGSPTWYADFDLEPVEADSPEDDEALRIGRFGRAAELRRRLTHIQLSGGLADLVYSMNTTNTDFYAHQYKPVLSFLDSPSRGLLIADEVGLGKTIEAGLIWTELRARVDARRLLVVCPKMLCDKWRLELRNRFGVEAKILDAGELAKELEGPQPHFPASQAMIASMQGIRPPLDWEDENNDGSHRQRLATILREAAGKDPLLDLVIIDEAHYMRNPETATHQLGQLLREATDHIVLLSATPINLKNDDLFSLLNLVDPDSFRFREQFQDVLAANEPLQRARLATLGKQDTPSTVLAHIEEAQQHTVLSGSKQLESLAAELSQWGDRSWHISDRVRFADRIERVNSLSRALTRTRKVDVTERKVIRHPVVQSIAMSETERRFYDLVTDAIKEYARSNDVSDGFLLATPQRQLSSCMYAAAASWSSQDVQNETEEMLYEDLGIEPAKSDISGFRRFLLEEIRGRYILAELRQNDSKFDYLLNVLRDFFSRYPSEKIVLFSYFRGTVTYLARRLSESGIDSQVLMGGMKEDKTDAIDRFKSDSSIRILLSSEVASEGVDLQFCRFLINYDLPWNPMKVEQRIGRIDRLGQLAEKIDILNLVYADTIDSRIVQRLYERLNLFERALGSLEAVLGEQIQELTADLLTGRLTPDEEEQRIAQTALALERQSQSERALEEQAGQLIAYSDYIIKRVHAARDLSHHISNDDLVVYVRDYLEKHSPGYHWVDVASDPVIIDLTLPTRTMAKLDNFIRERRLFGQTRLAEGGARRCCFVNKVRGKIGGIEEISQFHPFVRFISNEVESLESYSGELISVLVPSSFELPPNIKPGHFAFSVHRWTFEGLRTEEVIRARVLDIRTMKVLAPETSLDIVNLARIRGLDWPGATSDLDHKAAGAALEEAELTLIEDFNRDKQQQEAENADRVQFQLRAIQSHRDRKLAIERQRIQNLGAEPKNRGLVITAERTMERLNERFEIQLAKLEHTRTVQPKRESVSRGVIRIEAGSKV